MEAGRQKTAEWRPCLGQLPALASLLAPPRPTPWIDQDWRPDGSIVVLVETSCKETDGSSRRG